MVLAAWPGPATALFIHRTVRDGRRAGLAAVARNEIGLFVWLLAGGADVSALLVANRVLFAGMHIGGAVVLIILGFQAWRSARLNERDSGFASALIARLPSGRGAGRFRSLLHRTSCSSAPRRRRPALPATATVSPAAATVPPGLTYPLGGARASTR